MRTSKADPEIITYPIKDVSPQTITEIKELNKSGISEKILSRRYKINIRQMFSITRGEEYLNLVKVRGEREHFGARLVSDSQIAEVIDLRNRGVSIQNISNETMLTRYVVSLILKSNNGKHKNVS